MPRTNPGNQITPNYVVNISTTALTQEQVQVLSYGPKFCPVPRSLDHDQLLSDVKEGCRRLRLKEFFHDSPPSTIPKFSKKSTWTPPSRRNPALDLYCDTLTLRTESFTPPPPPKSNLSPSERIAVRDLRSLVKERKICISTADKGGAVVVQDFDAYVEGANQLLSNPLHYQKIRADPTLKIARESNRIFDLLHHSDAIDDRTFQWAKIDPHEVQTQYFYTLPKIHKDSTNPPGRPIVSCLRGPTVSLSKLVDSWLIDIVPTLPSYIQDSTHFLQTLDRWNHLYAPFPTNTFLVTMDVTSLYTNIPHPELEEAIVEAVNQNPDPLRPPLNLILQAMRHVLRNNVFEFNGQVYRQVCGTAMGTPMAPTAANLFMAKFEESLLTKCPWTIRREFWRRYIDDIFLLWTAPAEELTKFEEWANSLHPTIKFSLTSSKTDTSYLDIHLFLQDGFLHTDLYCKPTDTHALLHYKSFHPRHCKSAIPYGQLLRLRRICSDDAAFNERAGQLRQQLLHRGYPRILFQKALAKVKRLQRTEAMQYAKKTDNSTPVIAITNNPRNPPLQQWVQDSLPILHSSSRLQEILPTPPIITHRNPHSLRTILMPSRLPEPLSTDPPGCWKYLKKRCVLC